MTDDATFMDNMQSYDLPSRKAILQYLVRMGSFTSSFTCPNEDSGDPDVEFLDMTTWSDLKAISRAEAGITESIPRATVVYENSTGENRVRIMQWNILGQALADGCDVFPRCPRTALDWRTRRWSILHEIACREPDIICLQEVDHFRFFEKALTPLGFIGAFYHKPDSPCVHIPGNNGPDGCAIFINKNTYDLVDVKTRDLEIYDVQSNQVALMCKLRRQSDNASLWVVTTHLKARAGVLMEKYRKQQALDLVNYLRGLIGSAPILLAGDLNAVPTESAVGVFISNGLRSAYDGEEPSYTTWTIRESGEYAKTYDYVMYSPEFFNLESILRLPLQGAVGPERVPSQIYPSDHFSLVSDFVLRD